ncbi:hypothetical protein ACIA8K_10010 [Catenuloplanes sp. NPDC051500]|uniref:hypothetical protein n=1 Tax=Catenuloplanes sp. NPDC051500 TaxID=3363959 RepID=UPI00379B164D
MAEAQSRPRLTVIKGGGDPAAELIRMLAEAGVPEEVLDGLAGITDPDQIMAHLAEAGLLPGQGDAVAGLVGGFAPLTERGIGALEAEISGYEFLAAMRAAPHAPAGDDEIEMLIALAGQVEMHGGPAALAMLRLLAAIGPKRARPAAAQAADRLVAGGLRDRPWVKGLGRPLVGTAFGYGDDLGSQETVAVTFRYGRNEHAIAVLIDHHLGGGVKDIWAASEPDVLRAGFRSASRQAGILFHDHSPAEAGAVLRRALERPACPEQPDQVADVEVFLDLLRARLNLLPR